jgi:RNA polymerase sigma-70 factor (ECF subfamily)
MDIETLFQAYGNRLLRAAYLMCNNEPDARDLVQETFCQALDALKRFRGDSQEYTWLYAILRNQYRLHCRKNFRWFPLDLLFDHPAEMVDPWISLNRAESEHRMEAAMALLPFKHREVLILRYVDEMKVDDIAPLLRVSPGTVKSRLHHAPRELQKRLLAGKRQVSPQERGERDEM